MIGGCQDCYLVIVNINTDTYGTKDRLVVSLDSPFAM